MKFKKFFAAVLAGAVALSSFSLSASAAAQEVTLNKNEWAVGQGNWQNQLEINVDGITNGTTTVTQIASDFKKKGVTVTFTMSAAVAGETFEGTVVCELLAKSADGLWSSLGAATKSGNTYTASVDDLGAAFASADETGAVTMYINAYVNFSDHAADSTDDVVLSFDNISVSVVDNSSAPDGTKIALKENNYGTGTNWQGEIALNIPGITDWTTTAPEAAELIGDKDITVTFRVNDALSNGQKFDVSKLSFQGLAQTNDGLWSTYNATVADGTYTITMNGLADALSGKTGGVHFALVAFAAQDASQNQIDAYVDIISVTVPGGDDDNDPDDKDPGDDDPDDDNGEAKTFTGSVAVTADNGWGMTFLTSWAELLGTLDPAKTTVTFTNVVQLGYGLKADPWWAEVKSAPFTIDASLLGPNTEAGTEINIMIGVGETTTVTWVATEGGSGSGSGSETPSTPVIPSNPSTPSTSEPEETVNFEDGENDTDIKVEAPKDAFEGVEDVTFNAAPVPEETEDETFTFDLSFTDKDGNKVQPKSAVTVSVPVPAALTGKTVYVYHIEDNGTYTEISCKVENGMVVFTAKSFSKYVITSQKLSANGEPVTTAADPTTPNPGSQNEPNVATGVGGVAVVLGVAAIAAGALIVTKKRK